MKSSRLRMQFLILLAVYLLGISNAIGQTASLIAKNAFPSVVMIQTKDERGAPKSLGSGFFVRPDIIATNYHVIRGASSAIVKQVGKPELYSVEGIAGIDKINDLALLKIVGVSGKPLPLADLSRIDVGQDIYVLGNPQGLEGTLSTGIISSKALRQIGRENLIQITAPISPGSSGGPVVNSRGQVIGVATASLESGQNLNFAVPTPYVGILLNSSLELISFSKFLESELPSFEETTDWLTKRLSGLHGPTYSDAVITDTRIKFSGCTFEYWQSSDVGSNNAPIMVYESTSGSLADLKHIGYPPGSVSLNLRKEIPGAFLAFTFNDRSIKIIKRWPSRSEFNSEANENSLTIYLDDQKVSQSVESAFWRLRTLCSKP